MELAQWFEQLFSMEFWTNILDQLHNLGFLAGILLPMIEAFFPPLPLSLFVTLNVMVFGFFEGYMYSWIGTCIGSTLVFLIIKKLGRKRMEKIARKYDKVDQIFNWIKGKGFSAIFVLFCFPFTPSIVICTVAALAGVNTSRYILAEITGKLIMILSLSFIGFNISSFMDNPLRSSVFIIATLLITYLGKRTVENIQNKFSVDTK